VGLGPGDEVPVRLDLEDSVQNESGEDVVELAFCPLACVGRNGARDLQREVQQCGVVRDDVRVEVGAGSRAQKPVPIGVLIERGKDRLLVCGQSVRDDELVARIGTEDGAIGRRPRRLPIARAVVRAQPCSFSASPSASSAASSSFSWA
jgi:hypothetical protein